MTWWQWLLVWLAVPFALAALWIAACELTRWRHR